MSDAREFAPPPRKNAYPPCCALCGGTVSEEIVALPYPGGDDTTRMVNHVPAGVCQTCGERYLRADVAQRIEELLAAPPSGHETVPVWDFAATA